VIDLTRPGDPNAAWREPHIALVASGKYQTAEEQLQLDKVEIAANALRCDASGAMALAPHGGNIDLKGTVQYDWAKLAPLWQPYVGPTVQVVGHQTRPFTVHGKLSGDPLNSDSWRQVTGDAAIGWAGMLVHD